MRSADDVDELAACELRMTGSRDAADVMSLSVCPAIWIFRGCGSAAFGMSTVNTPSWNDALICDSSTPAGSWNERKNEP